MGLFSVLFVFCIIQRRGIWFWLVNMSHTMLQDVKVFYISIRVAIHLLCSPSYRETLVPLFIPTLFLIYFLIERHFCSSIPMMTIPLNIVRPQQYQSRLLFSWLVQARAIIPSALFTSFFLYQNEWICE